jgi:O-succinylbenzoate synthase
MTSGYWRLIELDLPLRQPFGTAHGQTFTRRIVLIGVQDGDSTGWGEAAPYPGISRESIDEVWEALTGRGDLPPTAAAAVEEAEADLRARQAGVPLGPTLGGSAHPVEGSIAVGISEDPVAAVARVVDRGYRAVKMKIEPGFDLEAVLPVQERFPTLAIGVDANGSYTWDDRESLLRLDALGITYIEQPFAPLDLEAHRRLRDETVAAVAIDEPIDSIEAAVTVVEEGAADLLVVKPARLGPEACRTIHDLALAAGLRVKASGLIETSIGRAHTLAIATLPGAIHSDLAVAGDFLETDPVTPHIRMTAGRFLPLPSAGIGCEPDEAAIAPYIVRETGRFSGAG